MERATANAQRWAQQWALTRRQVLKRGAAGAAVLMAPSGLLARPALAQGRKLKKFRTACPTPGGAWPVVDLRTTPSATLNLKQFQTEVHPHFGPTTTVWGYEPSGGPAANRSTYLGPTLVAERGTPVDITYVNQLPVPPLFEADPELVPPSHVDSRINTHLHGGRIGDSEDGNPLDAYGDASGQPEVPPGGSQTMSYPNEQGGTLLWYHDHALGITRTNVYAGLAGGYLLTEPPGSAHAVGNVPTAFDLSDVPDPYAPGRIPLHIPLVIQDKILDAEGQLVYPFPWEPEFFGDTCLVNGRAFPYLEVQPRRYRFTFLNGSQSRFYNLAFKGRVSITQIGVELGPIEAPAPISNILISPAERADVIVDFSKMPVGASIKVADQSLPRGVVSPTGPLGNCMEIRVVGPPLDGPDPFAGEPQLPGWTAASPTRRPGTPTIAQASKVTLEEVVDDGGEPVMAVVNGTPFMERDEEGEMTGSVSAPYATERIPNGATVDWLFLNLTADSHPFHTHLGHFEVMERWTFDAATYLADLETHRGDGDREDGAAPRPPGLTPEETELWDPATYPDPFDDPYAAVLKEPDGGVPAQEKGPKDTVISNPGEITRIRLVFDLPSGGPGSEAPAQYVFHCHILEHEENEMMRPLLIT